MFFRRKALFIILLLGLVFSLTAEEPQPAQAATIVVDGTTCTLSDAILAANTGATVGGCTGSGGADIITLNTDVTLTTADTTNSTQINETYAGLPDITSDITIQVGTNSLIERDGSFTCVSADADQFRTFNVTTGGDLTLDGLTLQNGCTAASDVSSQGGAIHVTNGSLTLQNTTLTNNTARGADRIGSFGTHAEGGAIYSDASSTVVISDSILMSNIAQGGDSDIADGGDAYGGAVASNALNTITNAIFDGNQAIGGNSVDSKGGTAYGGGAYNGGNMTNVFWSINLATGGNGNFGGEAWGGAAYEVFANTLTIVSFFGNVAQGGDGIEGTAGSAFGGALNGFATYTSIINVTFDGNQSIGGDATTLGEGGDGEGGAWIQNNPVTQASHLTIVNNAALGGTGSGGNGSVVAGGLFDASANALSIDNSILANNIVTPGGGSASANDCETTNGIISSGYNLVEAVGTCAFAATGDQTSVDPELDTPADNGCTTTLPDGSCVPTVTTSDINIIDQGSCTTSGATIDQRGEARPHDVIGATNVDDGCDIGAVEASIVAVCPAPLVIATPTDLTNCILWANDNAGADILQLSTNITLTAADTTNSTEINNSYAGLPDITSDITINAGAGNVIERDNGFTCVDSDPNEFRIFNITGAGAVLTLDGLTLQNACANARGGAIIVADGASLTAQNGTFANNRVVSNTDQIGGGAIYFWSAGSLNVTNNTFSSNIVNGDSSFGGAILITNGNVTALDDNIFDDNQAISIDDNSGAGNTAEGGAVAIWSGTDSVTSVSNNTFLGNIAQGGNGSTSGGRANSGALDKGSSLPIVQNMSNNIFDGNQALGGDGGTGNGGSASGGAANIRQGSGAMTFTNNHFSNNLAQGGSSTSADGGDSDGGALDTISSGSGSTIANLTFIDNTAQGGNGTVNGGSSYGGALNGRWAVDSSTFNGNLAQGGNGTSGTGGDAQGGGWFVSDDVNVSDHLTIANNQAIAGTGTVNGTALGGGIYIDDDYGFYFSNSIFGDNTVTPAGGSPTANDCDWGPTSYDESAGYNIIETPGTCVFTFDPTDITGVDPLLGTLADNGCTTTLPDGSCAETISLQPISEAIDGGSCTVSGASVDQTGTSRPQAIGGLPDADDACDIGAFEYVGSDYVNDAIVLFDPSNSDTGFLDSVLNSPNEVTYTNTPPTSANAEWVMGDWNGDGVKTPGIFDNGAFRYTNFDSASTNWSTGFWLGNAPGRVAVVAGRYAGGFANDNGNECIGWVDSNTNGAGDLRFSLKYWCDMTTTPQSIGGTLTPQWLAAVLSDSQGFTGTHQWVYGDWDNDGLDEPGVRRGEFITRSTNAPGEGAAIYGAGMAQRWAGTGGASGPGGHGFDDGVFVAGDWNGDDTDTWGVVYDDDIFYYRDVFGFNPGPWEFSSQTFTSSISAPRQVDSHHLANGGSSSPAPAFADGLVVNESGGTVDTSRNVEADLSVGKSGNYQIGEVGLVGDSIVWTITVSNTGTAPANGVQITDNVPAELRVDDALADNGTISVRGQIVTFTAESIGVGETVQFQMVTTILSEPNSGQFANSVNVLIPDGDGSGSDTNLVASGTVESVDNLPATGYAPTLRW